MVHSPAQYSFVIGRASDLEGRLRIRPYGIYFTGFCTSLASSTLFLNTEFYGFVRLKWHVRENLADTYAGSVFRRNEQTVSSEFSKTRVNGKGYTQ